MINRISYEEIKENAAGSVSSVTQKHQRGATGSNTPELSVKLFVKDCSGGGTGETGRNSRKEQQQQPVVGLSLKNKTKKL